jgi:hypothetical protein
MLTSSSKILLSEEVEQESLKVRSMYEIGLSPDWTKGKQSVAGDCSSIEEEVVMEDSDLLVSP